MAEIDNASPVRDGDPQAAEAISDASEGQTNAGDGDVRDVFETLRGLPSYAVKDLLSIGVCLRCILRLFRMREDICDTCTLSSSILSSVLGDLTDLEKHDISDGSGENGKRSESHNSKGWKVNEVLCSLCWGILQFTYCDDKSSVVRTDSAYDFASKIVELLKQEGHQIDGFSLEVSIPPVIQENELSVCLYMKKKYESETWFQRNSLSDCDSVKDALKTSITKPLEKLLDCKSNTSTFRIRLMYTQPKASRTVQTFVERRQGCKRRKAVTSTGNGSETVDDGISCADFPINEVDAVPQNSSETCQDSELSDQVSEPCQLVFSCYRTRIYFGGRYLKYSRNVSQTRWIIDDERMGDASVEELIGSEILPVCQGDNYKFHAAGREDIDVRMLGSGRPFLIEIHNARHVPCEEDLKSIEKKINNLENKLVGVRNLKIVGSQGWSLMHEGEAEKQKQYAALVWISRPLKDEDSRSISSYKEMHVLQKTPIRVLHRRSPMEREKIIHWMKIEKIFGSSQYFLLHLCTQAGTYIKEFVHGDLGRTHPSIGTILGCRAEILQLDVTDVKMDCF